MSESRLEIRQATRTAVKPLICFYSESGCGKTMSSLLLARGFVGTTGKIILGDTESGRGSLYADVIPGGYSTVAISEPFTPGRAIEVLQTIERGGAQIGILDSGSHFWEGIGGVLDMAGQNEAKSGKPGLHNWRLPKMEHAKFVLKLLQSPIPWIICLRAKHKTKQAKNAQGKTEIVKEDFTTPIQAEDFIFEMTAHAEILPDHSIKLTKCSHPALAGCFPKDGSGPVTIQHGEALAAWCAAPSGNGQRSEDPEIERKRWKTKLWHLTVSKHGGKLDGLELWLIGEGIMSDTEGLSTLTIERLKEITAKAEEKMKQPAAATV